VREELVRHRVDQARTAGIDVSSEVVERGVMRDIELVEGLRRGQDPTVRRPGKPERKPSRAANVVAQNPDEGLRLLEPGGTRERSALLHRPAFRMGEDWSDAVFRLGLIMQGATPATSPEAFVATANCPDLALEWWKTYADFLLRHRQNRHNRFLGLSDKDAARKLIRLVTDICDRSAGRLGPWRRRR
jgi:hypothetical protein